MEGRVLCLAATPPPAERICCRPEPFQGTSVEFLSVLAFERASIHRAAQSPPKALSHLNSTSPSLFALAACLATGVICGRYLLPNLNPAKITARVHDEERAKFAGRTGAGTEWIGQAKSWVAKVDASAPSDLPKLWESASKEPSATLPAVRLHLLAEIWKQRDAPAATEHLAKRSQDSPWAFLLPPAAPAAGKAAAVVSTVGDGLRLDNIPKLREAFSKAPQEAQPAAAEKLGAALAQVDALAAASWATSLSDGPEKVAAFRGVAAGWAETEPFPASEWLVSVPEGPLRGSAAVGFIQAAASKSPRLALPWALTIADPNLRRELMDPVLKNCARELPQAAKDILTAAELPAQELEDYLESLASYTAGGGAAP